MPETGDKKAAWDAYWRTGTLSAQTSGNKITEAPEAIAAWNGFFAKLPKGARILDLATGNGIVPAHANAYSREFGSGFEIMAVDQADIDPLGTVEEGRELLEGITFIGGIDIEDLPFEDAWFDAVTGQFAVEYANLKRTANESARVLKKGGRFRFVCHAKEGVIVAYNVPKAEQARWLLDKSGVFESLLAAGKEAFADSPAREETRATFRAKAVEAREKISALGENEGPLILIENLVRAYIGRARFETFDGFREWVEGVKTDLAGQIDINEALAEAALDFNGIQAFAETLQAAGFDNIAVAELLAGPKKQMLGWQIEGVKS